MDTINCVAFGLFHDRDWARGAQDALKAVGFASDDIGLLEVRRRPHRQELRAAHSRPGRQGSRRVVALLDPAETGVIGEMLVGKGMARDQARHYEDEIRYGNSLVAVRTAGNADVALTILRRFGAYDVRPYSAYSPVRQLAPAPLAVGQTAGIRLRS